MKQWQLLKKAVFTKSTQPALSPQAAPPRSLYQNINSLPLSRYIDCDVDGNYNALVLNGHYTPEELQQAWQQIQQQAAEASGSNHYNFLKSIIKETNSIQFQLNLIYQTVDALRLIQNAILLCNYNVPEEVFTRQKQMAKDLNSYMRTAYLFNPYDTPDYYKKLDACIRRSASLKIKYDLRMMALEEAKKKAAGTVTQEAATRDYYDKILINLSDYAKYEISDSITVSKFYERIKRYNDYCQNLNKK